MAEPWTTRAERETILARVDERLRDDPLSVDLQLDRARLLVELDRADEARDLYLRVLARDANRPRALNDFGTLLLKTGYRAAARTVFERALAVAPGSAPAHVQLANVLFTDGEFEAARSHYDEAVRLEPAEAEAHQGLSYALTRLGRLEEAEQHRRIGFAGRSVTTAAYRGVNAPVDVLRVVAAAGGTLYTDEILDDRIFRTTTLVADAYDGTPLPDAQVVFNAISDTERSASALHALEDIFARLDTPVINPPALVRATTRIENARRFAQLPNIIAPHVDVFSRSALVGDGGVELLQAHGFTFPLLLRAPGFHTGEHFERVDEPAALAAATAALPGEETLAIAFHDVRDAAGIVRKYRVMFVDGALYPVHAALAHDWKVHYFTAEMASVAEHRAEDARFLADPEAALGSKAIQALHALRDVVRLDYFGVDFSLDATGRVVVFEANATMIVVPPGPGAMWDYRRPHVRRIIDAARTMIVNRAG